MSKTLSQIRDQVRILINETDTENSHYTDTEIDGFINQAQELAATLVEFPRDTAEVQVEEGKNVYSLPSDYISVVTAYFGDNSKQGDIKKLDIFTEKELSSIRPAWLSDASGDRGEPDAVMLVDRTSVLLSPTPDATSSATGKKLYITYVYSPATMSTDVSTPDLPLAFHDILQFWATHLAYLGKLQNPDLAFKYRQEFYEQIGKLNMPVTKEKGQMNFFWDTYDEFGDSDIGRIDPRG